MADAKSIKIIDEKLIEDKIIDEAYLKDYPKVHKLLNSHIRKHGKILDQETFKKGDAILRDWLNILHKQGASQEKLTSYLRCGLAHLSFDYIDSTYESISKEDLVTRALQSFKKRKFNKSFYKAPKEKPAEISKKPAAKKTTTKKDNKVKSARLVKSAKQEKKPAVKRKPAK